MKKILSLAVLVAGVSFAAVAQDVKTEVRQDIKKERRMKPDRQQAKTPEEVAKLKTDHMDKELKFSEKQKAEVYAFQLDKAKKMEGKRKEMMAAKEQYRKEMKADQDRLNKILTPEQQELMKNKIAEGKKGRFQRDGKNYRHREMRHKRMDKTMPIEKESKELNSNSSNS